MAVQNSKTSIFQRFDTYQPSKLVVSNAIVATAQNAVHRTSKSETERHTAPGHLRCAAAISAAETPERSCRSMKIGIRFLPRGSLPNPQRSL